MPSSAKQAKTTAFNAVCAAPFTRVHGRLTRKDFKILKEEASALASEVEDITYTYTKDAMTNYGLLVDILGFNNYYKLTSIDTYAVLNKPVSYNPTIMNATLTHERKCKEKEWDLVRTLWFIRKGFLKGAIDNLCNALDKQYYCQLKHRLTAYRNITLFQILKNLNDHWCPLNVQAKKELRKAYYSK
jgi:hypothetical protein